MLVYLKNFFPLLNAALSIKMTFFILPFLAILSVVVEILGIFLFAFPLVYRSSL